MPNLLSHRPLFSRSLATLALVALGAGLSGCAGMGPSSSKPSSELFADARFAPPSTPIGAQDLFTLSPEMQAYLHSSEFAALQRKHGEERGLIEALYSKQHLKLEYESSRTRTAAETYAEKSGNCLSLVVMTAAFARELGMRVVFQSVDVEETWGRSGNLYLTAGHVNVVIGRRLSAGRVSGRLPGQSAHCGLGSSTVACLILSSRNWRSAPDSRSVQLSSVTWRSSSGALAAIWREANNTSAPGVASSRISNHSRPRKSKSAKTSCKIRGA